MFRPLATAFVVSTLLLAGLPARAEPIIYDFTGTLRSPVAGADQFSGSFTINGNPTVDPTNTVIERSSDVSITLNLGGHVFTYENTPQQPNETEFWAQPSEPGSSTINMAVDGLNYNGPTYDFSINLSAPGDTAQLADLARISHPKK